MELAFGLAGAALGTWATAGTMLAGIGGSLGFSFGSAIGGHLFGPKIPDQHLQQTPLEGLTFTSVPLGEMIPYQDGVSVTGGNCAWISEIRKIPHVQVYTSSGGGFFGIGKKTQTTTVTTYTYEFDALFVLSHHRGIDPPVALRRFWYNSKLLYNIGSDATENTLRSSYYSSNWSRLTFYDGNLSQLPDDDYVLAVGEDFAPAYRGMSSVFIKSFQLGATNQLGNFRFEVVRQADVIEQAVNIYTPSQIYIAMDVSGSMGGIKLTNLKTAMNLLCDELQIVANNNTVHRIMLVAWSSSVVSYGEYTSNTGGIAAMRVFIDGLAAGGGTSAIAAVENAHIFFAETPNKHNISVIISDGEMSDVSIALTDPLYKIQDMLDTTTGSYSDTNGNSVYMRGIGINTTGSLASFDNSGLAIPVITDANPEQLAAEILKAIKVKVNTYSPITQTCQSVVGRIMDYSKVDAGNYDTTALSSIGKLVYGLNSADVTSGRALLESLMVSHNFSAYSANKIVFFPLATESARTFTYDEVGAGLEQAESQPFNIVNSDDNRQGAYYSITYPCIDNAHDVDTRHADRLLTVSDASIEVLDLPIVMTTEQAQGVADTLTLRSAQGRYVAANDLSVFISHDDIKPGDIITTTDRAGRTYKMRVTRIAHSSPMFKMSLVMDDGSNIRETGITDSIFDVDDSIVPLANTVLTMLDIPTLADGYETSGLVYAYAAYGDTTNWPGCEVHQSVVSGSGFEQIDSIGVVGVVGTTQNALADVAYTGAIDFTSSITASFNKEPVAVSIDEIEANPRAGLFAVSGANGWEMIQVIHIAPVSAGVWRLSGFYRGCFGTDHAMSGHAIGDTVVKIQSGVGFSEMPLSWLNKIRYYKGVTAGQSVASAQQIEFSNSGVAKKPYRPVDASAVKSGNNIVVNFGRQTRLEHSLFDPFYLPLGEDSELYEIDIYDGVNVVRTEPVTTTSFTWTDTMQTADFGGLQNSIHCKIYQISAQVGRGYPLDFQSETL